MSRKPIEKLLSQKRFQEALAHALHEYREDPSPELRSLVVSLRGVAARTLWCSPSICLSEDSSSLAIRRDNGQVALSACFDKRVLVRSIGTGEVEWKPVDLRYRRRISTNRSVAFRHPGGIDAITYSRSGERLLILTHHKKRYRLYELHVESGKSQLLAESPRIKAGVCRHDRTCLSESGRVLAFGSQDHPVRGYDFEDHRWFKLPGKFMAFDGSGRALSQAEDGSLVEIDLDNRADANGFEPVEHDGLGLRNVAYRNGVVTYCVDRQRSRRLAVRTLASGQERVIESEDGVFDVTLSGQARYLAWSGWDSISCQDLSTGARVTHSIDVGYAPCLDFLGTEALVVAGDKVRTPRFLPLPVDSPREDRSPSDLLPVEGHTCEITRIEIDREGLRAEDDGSIRHWSLETGEQLSQEAVADVPLPEAPFEDEVTDVLHCGDDGLVGHFVADDRLWVRFDDHDVDDPDRDDPDRDDVDRDDPGMAYPMGGGVFGVCFAPRSSTIYVMVSVKLGKTRLVAFDLETRSIRNQLDLQKDTPGVLAVSEVRGVLATANRFDHAVSILDLKTGHLIQELPILSELDSLAMTECGSLLACGTATGSVILWQLGVDGELEPTELSEETLDQWQRDTGFVRTAKGLRSIPRPGEHYRNTEWAKHCQE